MQVPASSLDMERIVCLKYFKADLSDPIHLWLEDRIAHAAREGGGKLGNPISSLTHI